MTIGSAVPKRNANLDSNTTFIGGGAKLRIYTGPRPATGAAITTQTLLAEFTCGTPFAPAAANAVLSPTLPAAVNAAAAGTAAWFRLVKADGLTHCDDGDVTDNAGVGDLKLNTTTITAGLQVSVTSWTINRGNP